MLIEDFKLENWIAKYENITKYDLSQTCIQNLTLKELEEICDSEIELKNIRLGYGQLHGTLGLKRAICSLYDKVSPSDVTVTLGGIGANELALKTFINKGDTVVCVIPCYQQLYTLPKLYGANVILSDLNDLAKKAKGAQLICVNNPNNPTGTKYNDDEINAIINTARENNSYIFADEVYRGLPYTKSFSDLYEKAIVTGSMSKTYSLAGIRLGWIVSEETFIKKVNLNREYNTISISAIDDKIAETALNNHTKIEQRNLKIIKNNKIIVEKFLQKTGFSWVKEPDAAAIGCVKYNSKTSSAQFCENIVKNTGVLLIPAYAFDSEGFFRLGFGMEENYLKSALKELINYII